MPAYKRPSSLMPMTTGYCPGCLHALATRLVADVIDELNQKENAVNVVSVGCSALNLYSWAGDVIGAAHGRAPAVATGVKRSMPERLVFTYQGDGDLAAIGLAEIMSAANRGENFTVVFANNQTYGMTGGQMAPTTLIGQKSTTTRFGRDAATTGYPLQMCELISVLKAPVFVARYALNTPKGVMDAKKGIKKAFELQLAGKGFTFIELLTNCPTNWGLAPDKAIAWLEENMMPYYPLGVYKDKYAE